jgi:hypothetical protein
MENFMEIAGTGFFFSRKPDGAIDFARGAGEDMQPMDPDMFSRVFGSEVNNPDARKQAQGILTELNSSRRSNFSLAPFSTEDNRAVQANQEMNSVLGGMMQ